MIEKDSNMGIYSTIPLAIILVDHVIITVCLKEDTLLNDFINNKVKTFLTQYKNRFVLQILYKNSTKYLQYLKILKRQASESNRELLNDVIIENKQAIEMANIYSSILSGTMDAFASIISNNLNIVMKFLASVTIVMQYL